VIIYGLNGNAIETWTHPETKTFWPCDFLPQDVPEARIMTYDYNSDVISGNSTADIIDHSKSLLACLLDMREGADEEKRPIIFIAHSLGGLAIKQVGGRQTVHLLFNKYLIIY
jgi:hypothetical protein